ncbi:MAG: hypothetical protein JWO06_2838 [Bacteroidota bacterium]|nr:hypothetical protein [Bacteroidota bacterium]
MTVAPLTYDDIDEAVSIQPPEWNIMPSLNMYLKSPVCFPIKICIEGKIVGIGTSIKHRNSAWLAHIIVHPAHRNKGIGTLVTEALLDGLSCDTVSLVATKEGEPIYRKLGFKPENIYVVFKGANIEASQSSHSIPYDEGYKSELLDMDRKVSGEDRNGILINCLATSRLFVRENKLEAFYLPDLNEGLIIAEKPEAGLELLKLRLSKIEGVILPEQNDIGIEFLRGNGYAETSRRQRMTKGKRLDWQPDKIFARIGGNLG